MAFNQAEAYDRNFSQNPAPEKRDGLALVKLLSIPRGSKVLDFGCGTGNSTKMLADMVGPDGEVVGVDPDAERLKVAREKHSASNLTYIEGSIESIPGMNYDIVFSSYVLHRCKNIEEIFQKMAQILKKGGKFGFVTAICCDSTSALFQPKEAYSQEFINFFLSSLYLKTPDEFATLATADFEVAHSEESKYNFKFDDVEDLVMFMKTNSGMSAIGHINAKILEDHYKEGGILDHSTLIAVFVKK